METLNYQMLCKAEHYILCLSLTHFSCFHIFFFRNLMARQDMSELGFGKELETESPNTDDEKIKNQSQPSTDKQ